MPARLYIKKDEMVSEHQNIPRAGKDSGNIVSTTLEALVALAPQEGDPLYGERKYGEFQRKVSRKRIRLFTGRTIRYAAVLALLITSVTTAYYLGTGKLSHEMNTIEVPPGQRTMLKLADGTDVWLNAGARLRFPSAFARRYRDVEIEGEGYFEVAKDSRHPFRVIARNARIEVLGTKFNVNSDSANSYLQTDLIEGAVKLVFDGMRHEPIYMSPNQQVRVKDGNVAISEIRDTDHLLWKDGIFSFKDERLCDILAKLEKCYGVNIIVESESIYNQRYTGKFRQADGIDRILSLLQKIYPFKITRDESGDTITLSR